MDGRSARSRPTGPGSRGGRWHDPEFRRAYHRAWREAHPEYRERDALRAARARAVARGEDPTLIVEAPKVTPRLPVAEATCMCECGCKASIPRLCGLCRDGLHDG